jgi:hypothetical protein
VGIPPREGHQCGRRSPLTRLPLPSGVTAARRSLTVAAWPVREPPPDTPDGAPYGTRLDRLGGGLEHSPTRQAGVHPTLTSGLVLRSSRSDPFSISGTPVAGGLRSYSDAAKSCEDYTGRRPRMARLILAPGVDQMQGAADLGLRGSLRPSAQILASGPPFGHGVGDAFALDVQFHLGQGGHHGENHRPHGGVRVHVSPPRFSARSPAPRSRSNCAKVSMFWVDRPNRSRVVMTSVPPASRAVTALSNFGREARAPDTPWST